MSEIEKMYSNAGLSNMWVERYNDGYYEHERYYNSYKEMINNMMKANDWTLSEAQEVAKRECRKEHPPFTPEKQIELIKFLMKQEDFSWTITQQGTDTKYVFYVGYEYGSGDFKEFTEALAGIINDLWAMQDLSEEEKQQIKEILE